ncbi:MAG: S-layer homology domain-containing protein [Clostridiales bacterium]|jgi:hypothetical protein|nr:S-layer homology domain-containing protein [Clostridiales bacterium]
MIYNMDGALTATLQPNEHGYFYTPSQRGYFRVVASSRGFAPALSTVSPTWVGPTGGNADILLTPIEAGDPEYLLLASLQITTPDDSGITIDDAYLVLRTGEGDTPLDFGDDGMWRMPSNSPLEGDVVVVLPGQTDPYILIPVEYRPIDAGSYHHNVAMVFLYVVALPPPDPGHGTIFGFVYCQCFANPNERLPGTEVSLPGLGRTAETDERGFYFFHNVPFGTHNLFVSDPPDGFNSAISEDGPAVLNETYRTAQLDFYLRLIEVEAYAIVWGRVFDYEHPQQPGIAGATVQLTHYPHYTPTPRPPATTHIAQTVQATTDSQGFFVIGPVARNHDLLVRATHDYFSIYTGEMRVYENQDHRERNIGMINFDGTTVRVRVHDESESNAPQNLLPNAEVLLILPDGRGVLEGRTRPNIDNNDIIEAVFHLSRGLLDELRNGTDPIRFDYFVQLDGFDIVFDYFDLPHPSPDELEPPVYVALSSGGFQALLWGRVYDERDPEDDVPLLTATVWPPSKLQPGGNSHEDVDPEDLVSDTVIGGYYFIIVSSAEINAIFAQSNILNMIFIAEAPGFSTAAVDLDLEVGRTLRHDFFLNALENHDDPQPLLLLGNVTSYVGGQPVGGATVAVAYTHGFGYVDRPYRVSAMTDDLGAYVIIDIPAGQHDVRATASGRFGAAYDEITVVNQNVRRDFALPSTVDVEIRLYVDARSDNNHYYTEMLRNLPAGTVGAENFRVNLPDLSAFGEGYMLDLTDPPQPNFRTINLATWNSADDYVFWIIIPAQREIEVHHVLPMPAFDDDGDPIDGEYDYKLFAMGDIIYAPANTRATAQAYIGPDYRLVDFRIIHIDEDGNEVDPHPFDPQPSLNREASPAELTFMVAPDKTQRVEFIYELTIEVSVRGVIGHFEYGVLVYNDDPPYLYHHIRHLNANTPEVLIPFTNLSSVLYRIDWIVVDAAGEPVDYVLREGDGIVIDVGVENIQITFVYRDLNTVVQINAFEVNEQGEVIGEPDPENIGSFLQIPGFPMMIPAVEGRELPVPPPAIPGFVWVYSPDGESIVPSAEYDNSLTFHYVRSVGNLTVHAVEYGTGRTIRTISRNIAYGDDYTVIFDQLLPGRWYYTLSAGQSVGQQTFTYDDTPAVLNVYFDRVLRDVTVRAVLAGTGELLATVENYGSHRGGEFALISVDAIRNLPALEGFIPVMTEMPIMIGETDNVVTFFFIVDPDPYRHVDIVVELREYPNNELIDSFTIRARRGETITINAPERMGWHLHSTPDYRRITVPLTGAVDNVVFEYTRINVPITVHLEDSDGNVLPAPPNFEIAFNLLQGEHRYITAPNIVGWVLAQGQEAVRRVGLPAEGGANTTSITFVFESLEDVINRNLVDVTVRGVNLSAGRATLYEQSFRHLRDTEFTAHAVLLPGFQLITSSPYTYNVGIGREFIFEYQSLHIQNGVRIYTVDASGNNVASPIWIPAVIGQPFTFNAPHIPGFHLAEGEYLIQGFDSVPEDADARYLTFIYERQPGAIEVIAVEEGTGRIIRTSAIAGVVGNNTVHAPESLVAPYYNLIGDATQTVTIEPSDNIVRATFEFERVTVAVNRIARYRDDHVPIGDPSPTTAIHRLGDIAMISAPTQTNINELEDYILWSQSPVAVWVQTPNQVVNFDYMPLGDAAITVIAHAVGNINQVIQTFTFPVALNSTVYVAPPTIEGWETTETAREVPNIQGNTPVFFEYTMRMVNITVNHLRYGDNDTTVASARTIPVQYGSTIRVDAPHIDGHVIVLGDGEQSFRTFGRIREDQVIDFVYRPISEIIDRYTVDITIIGVDRVSTLELYRYTFSRPINSEFRVYAMALLGFTVYGDDYFDLDIREEDITRTFRYNPEPTTVQIQAVEEGSGRILAQFNVAAREGHAFAYRAPVVPGFDFVRVQGNTDPDYLYGRIEEVRHGESLTFVYRARPTPPAGQGVVTVVLREGLQILMERSIIFTVGVSQTITAPDLSASHFRHEGPSSIPDHYFDPDNPATHRVFFDYVKNTTTVTVEGRNTAAGNDVIYERAIPDTRLGEVIPVSAPAVDGFTVIGEISRNVWVSTADQVIPFYLEPTAPDDVVVNMLYGARRIGSQIITAPAGTTVTVSAPDLAGAGFRLVGSESQVTVTAPYEVNFYYETDPDRFVSINITLWNTENDEAISPPQGFIYEIPVLIGTSGYVFAPHVPGYVLAESSNMFYAFDNMDADEAVTFYYVPIEYIIDQHLVDVIVRGVNDANNATLYEQSFRHPRNTYFTAHAVNLPGFRLITPTPLTRDVGSGDTFIFRYESLHMHEGVMIHAELVDGTPIAPYPIYIPAVIGEPFTFNAPHIPGFHLAAGQPLLRGFEAVPGAEAERYLRFVYVPHQGAIEVVAVDRDSGRVIRTAAIPGVPGNNVVNAPNLAPFYTLVSAPTQNVDLTHLDGLTRVTFEFERVLVSVNRVAIDSEDGAQIGNAIPSAGHRLGDIAMINAPTTGEIPELERFILDSQSPLAVWVMEANQDVNFNYTYMGDSLAVTVTARDVANTGHIIQSFTLVVDYGADITITAPVITGWMNPSPASRSLTNVQQNATVTFDYTMQTVTVTINHLRYGGGAPVAAPTVFDAQVGSLIRVYAPHIHGFVLAPGETGVHAPARLTENIEINFVYRPIEEVIDQFTAAVTIRGVDRLSNLELYSFTVRRPLNSVFEVHAMPLLGFVLSPTTPPQANPFTLNIGANPDASYTHTFSYDRAPATVRIRAEDVDGNQILEFNVAAQAGHPFSYRAPVVPGYDFVRVYGNANDDYLYGRIASVGSNDVLTFVYAPRPEPLPGQGIVTVVLREVQGIDQILMERSIIFTEDVPQTITAPSLAASHFRHEGPSSIPNHNFDPNNPATHRVYFDYVKLTTTVTVEGRSTAAGNAIVVTDTIANVRLGEVRAIDAPMHNDYIALGETPRRVLIHAPNQVVVFDMQPTTDDDVVVNMYHGALLIGRQVITALSGTQVTVNAPDLSGVGFMLVGNVSQVTVTAPAVVNFHFERDPARFVNINITLWDAENDVEIPAPSGFISNIPILRGTSGHVFAPHIPGFMLAAGSNFFYQWHDMDDNETVTFYYTPLRVGEHVVNISVYTVILDENGNIVSTTQVDAFTEHVGRTFNIWAETPPVGYRLTRRVAEFAGEPADILNLGDWGSSALPVFSVANISQSLIVRFYFEPMPDDQSVVWIEFVEYNDHATVISGLWVENVVQGEYYHYTIRRSLERFPGRLVHDASGFNGWDARVVDADDRSQIIGELRMDGYSRISFIVQPGLNVLQIPYNKAVEDIDITVRHVVRGEGRTLAEHIESGSKGREIRWNEAILDGWAAEANIPSGYIRLGVANAANIPGVADRAGIEIIIEYAPLPINNEAIIIRHVATPPDRYGEPQDEEWFLGSNIVGLLDEAAQGFQGVLMSNEVIPASQNILQNAMPETARAILIDLLPYNDLVVAELYDILTDMGFNLTPPPQQYLEYLTPPLPEEEKEEDEGEEKEEDEKDEDDEKVEEEKGADEDDKGADDEVAEEDVVVYEPEIIADVDATTIDPAVIAVILAILQDANTDIGEIISRATRTLIRGILEAADIYDIQEILSNADEGQLSDILNNHPAVEAIITELMMHYAVGGFTPKLSIVDGRLIIDVIYNLPPLEVFLDIRLESEDGEFLRNIELPYGDMPWGSVFNIFELEREEGVPLLTADDTFGFALYEPDSYVFRAQRLLLDIGAAGLSANAMANEFHARATFRQITRNIVIEYRVDGEATPVRTRTIENLPFGQYHVYFNEDGWLTDNNDYTHSYAPGHRTLVIIWYQDEDDLQDHLVEFNVTRVQGGGNGGGGGGGGGGGWLPPPPFTPPPTPPTRPEPLPQPEVEAEHYVWRRYIRGYEDGTVRPDGLLTRAEMVQMLFNLAVSSEAAMPAFGASRFSDIAADSWYFTAISYFADRGQLQGFPDGSFRPNDFITNAEFAAMATRILELDRFDFANPFAVDAGHWGAVYIARAFDRGWFVYYLEGFGPEYEFDPDGNITRAQTVALINHYTGRIPNSERIDAYLDRRQLFNDLNRSHWAFYELMKAAITHERWVYESDERWELDSRN